MDPNGKKPRDTDLDEALINALAEALKPVAPDASVKARLRGRLLEYAGLKETEVVRAGEGEWKELLPGIAVKTLHLDREKGIQTSLWRLDPGSRIPRHTHTREEECLVLEGSIVHAGETYRPGDYLYAKAGVRHESFHAPEGALLLIRSELVPETSRLTRFLYRLFYG